MTEIDDNLKKVLYKIWDKEPKVGSSLIKLLGLNEGQYYDVVMRLFVEYLGGIDSVKNIIDEKFDNILVGKEGGYNFKFKVQGYKLQQNDEGTWYLCDVFVFVDPKGEVVLMNDGETYTLEEIPEIFPEDNWEVENEIRDVVENKIFDEVTSKTGVPVQCQIDIDFGYGDYFMEGLQENIRRIKGLL